MQHLLHHLQPTVTGREKRHIFEDQLENPCVNKFWDRKKKEVVEERKGVLEERSHNEGTEGKRLSILDSS